MIELVARWGITFFTGMSLQALLLRFLAGGLLRLLDPRRSSIDSTTSGRSLPKRLMYSSSMNAGSGSFQGSWWWLSSLPSFLGFMPSSRAI